MPLYFPPPSPAPPCRESPLPCWPPCCCLLPRNPHALGVIWKSVENCAVPAHSAEYLSSRVRFEGFHGCECDRVEKMAAQR